MKWFYIVVSLQAFIEAPEGNLAWRLAEYPGGPSVPLASSLFGTEAQCNADRDHWIKVDRGTAGFERFAVTVCRPALSPEEKNTLK